MFTVEGFAPAPGLWWRELYRAEGRVALELVGYDTAKLNAYSGALNTLSGIVGLPHHALVDFLVKIRPDLDVSKWLRSYLKVVVADTIVEGKEEK